MKRTQEPRRPETEKTKKKPHGDLRLERRALAFVFYDEYS